MKSYFVFLFLAVACAFSTSARAQMFTQNGRIDHAIYPTHDPEIILAGRIVRKNTITNPPAMNAYPANVTLEFKVSSVVLGDQSYLGKTLPIPVTSFDWPVDLLPCEEGVDCVFLFNPSMLHEKGKPDRYYIDVVVPTRAKTFPSAKDGVEAKKMLEDEILAQLDLEKDPLRQRELLCLATPILEARQSSHVEPFVSSPDVWVKRAALAAMIYATEKEEFIRPAASDIQNFFTTTKGTDVVKGPSSLGRGSFPAYPYFFKFYFFLEKRTWTWGSRWDEAEATKNLRIVNALMDTGLISPEVKQQIIPPRETLEKKGTGSHGVKITSHCLRNNELQKRPATRDYRLKA